MPLQLCMGSWDGACGLADWSGGSQLQGQGLEGVIRGAHIPQRPYESLCQGARKESSSINQTSDL